ncbi:hypothetical protein [Streptomyces cavourensis]|uniref:hypothetical protein n=1 Tax=Streptomyces cavourensis TaxID=67258 RepID=UPI0024AF81BC|nr:hypothetical protein [Streptomyces cavourensis]MDI7787916.1 hypothetical protein [Streptomyces cavourensis]
MADQTGRLTEAEEQLLAYLRQATDAIDPSARPITERWTYTSQYDLLLREGRLSARPRSLTALSPCTPASALPTAASSPTNTLSCS